MQPAELIAKKSARLLFTWVMMQRALRQRLAETRARALDKAGTDGVWTAETGALLCSLYIMERAVTNQATHIAGNLPVRKFAGSVT